MSEIILCESCSGGFLRGIIGRGGNYPGAIVQGVIIWGESSCRQH